MSSEPAEGREEASEVSLELHTFSADDRSGSTSNEEKESLVAVAEPPSSQLAAASVPGGTESSPVLSICLPLSAILPTNLLHGVLLCCAHLVHDTVMVASSPFCSYLAAQEPPFPWGILLTIYAVVLCDGLAFGTIAPLLDEMCTELWGISQEDVGFRAGLMLGAYAFGQFCSNMVLGHFSDRLGRKRFVALGLTSGVLCTLAVPVAPSYWLALLARLIAGLLNSNIAVAKAIISDVTTPKQRARGYAYQGASFALSRFVSSFIGAAFAGYLLPLPLVSRNPYFLPCLVTACINFLSMVFFMALVRETSPSSKRPEQGSLLSGLAVVAGNRLHRNLILEFALNAFTNVGFIACVLVFMPLPLDKFGYGFDARESGIMFGIFGLAAFSFQFGLFDKIQPAMGNRSLYKVGLCSLMAATILFPLGSILPRLFGPVGIPHWVLYLVASAPLMVASVGYMTSTPLLGAMISSTTLPSRQGLTQGFMQSSGALLRSFGPPFFGGLFSVGVVLGFPYMSFFALAGINLVTLVLFMRIDGEDAARIDTATET